MLVALHPAALTAQGNKTRQVKPLPAPALMLAPIVGQPIPILPISFVLADTGLGAPVAHAALLAWADSVIVDGLQARGSEAHWLTPADLRRTAKRAPGIVTDPDYMSQSVMRFEGLKKVPDPLLANIRALVAITNSRYVMVPAALRISGTPGHVHAELTMVLADARSGTIAWRSTPVVDATTAAEAVAQAIAHILPDLR